MIAVVTPPPETGLQQNKDQRCYQTSLCWSSVFSITTYRLSHSLHPVFFLGNKGSLAHLHMQRGATKKAGAIKVSLAQLHMLMQYDVFELSTNDEKGREEGVTVIKSRHD